MFLNCGRRGGAGGLDCLGGQWTAPKRRSVKQRVSQFKCRTILEPCRIFAKEPPNCLLLPGVYLYKDAYDTVIYVGKAKNLRARVRSYFSDERLADSKTGTLISEARHDRLHSGR